MWRHKNNGAVAVNRSLSDDHMKSNQIVIAQSMNEERRKVIKRRHYPLGVMLTCVRWYVACPLSLRHIEKMMANKAQPPSQRSSSTNWPFKRRPKQASLILLASLRQNPHPPP